MMSAGYTTAKLQQRLSPESSGHTGIAPAVKTIMSHAIINIFGLF